MLRASEHDRHVARLYAAAAGDIEWAEMLGELADGFGHSAAVLVTMDPAKTRFWAEAHGKPRDFVEDYYRSETFLRDPRTPYFVGLSPGQIYCDRLLYDVDAMLRDDRVRETVTAIGVQYQIGATLRLPNGVSGMLTLLSTPQEGHASREAIESFQRLAPHIEQACALGEIIERQAATQTALIEALAQRADGILLLASDGALIFANDMASAILAAGDGLGRRGGQFVAARGPETRRLARLVESSLRSPHRTARAGGQMLVTRPSGLLPYVVRVLPAPMGDRFLSAHTISAVVHIHDLSLMRIPSAPALREIFGLSQREADLAVALVRHTGLRPAAASAGMALNTGRNHLQGIFRKCGVASQAQAIQLFSRWC